MLSTIDLPHTGVGLGGVSQYRSHDELSIGYNVINYYLGNLSETTYSYSGAHLPILIIESLPLILQSHARDLYYNNKEGYFNRFGISNYMSWEVAKICEICNK